MRVAFISFYEAFPPCSGAASVTYNSARYAPGERFLIQLGNGRSTTTTPDGIHLLTLPWSASRAGKLTALRRRVAEIGRLCRQIGPDVVVLQGASWSFYCWLLLRELKARIAAPVVYHAHNVEYLLRRQKHGALVSAVTHWAEGRIVRRADLVFAVSSVDQEQFEQLYGRRPELLPNGVDCQVFGTVDPATVEAARAKYGLTGDVALFMGLYGYRPNTEAVEALVRQIFPAVRQWVPEARLAVLGGDIPHRQPWLIAPGRIPHDELPAFVAACRLGVAPIFSGSGTRLKILEYLAAGLPVVSTPKGAEGLDLVPGEHLQIAADAQALAHAMVAVFQDRELAARLGQAGQQRVRQCYDWRNIINAFWETVQSRVSHDGK